MICIHPIHHRLRQSPQGVARHNLKPTEKQASLITLRRLTECHGLLPYRIRIRAEIEVCDEILGSGGFADVRSGKYNGRPVAVKIMRVSAKDDYGRMRKVSANVGYREYELNHPIPAILQGSCTLEHAISSKHLGTRRSSGRHEETTAHYRIRADGVWKYHEIHQRESHKQTGTGPQLRSSHCFLR